MVLYTLRVKCNAEGIKTLYTPEDFTWIIKVKCVACGEDNPNYHPIDAETWYDTKERKAKFNFVYKCKLCSRENFMNIVPKSASKLNAEKFTVAFTPLVKFDCRGLQPVDFAPGKGWVAVAEESEAKFTDVDLSEKEWVDYDEKNQQSVGIYEFQSDFVVV